MDREARSRLRRLVIQSRDLLEEDFRTQLKRLGIEEGGKTIPVGRLQHLTSGDRGLRERILTIIDKEQGKKISRLEAYDRYIRHVGFTYLNRVAALRAMEVRGLLSRETVARRDQYAGMSERAYLIAEREGLSDPGEITRRCLLEAFEEISQEIKVLFDMGDEYSLLFPSTLVLDQVIELMSVEVPEEDWLEDDVIGWIYQYYNSEARSEFRKNRRKPRADDIPVINQFYTPRWLVRALVDNTLGRLWLEMKGRMPRPSEAEAPSEERLRNPQGETVDEYCSYLIPPRQDHPPRDEKNVREIKVLDPACGSGHFIVYAFNVLYRMYLEDEPDTPREDIPKLILENNLYGIDIDLRSVQLAALSLYLKAKEYNPGVKIERMNLVCADARIIDGALQKEFLKGLEPDIELQRIFSKLFDELEYTYDVGSLLKVRQPFERLINERGLGTVQFRLRPMGQSTFSKEGEVSAQTAMSLEEQREAVLVKPAVTLEEMLGALVKFEREGMEKKDMGTMLFAAEAEKSVGLLSLLSNRYDIVVMNPPYGDMPKSTKEYAREHYPRTHYDYYAAFIEQAVDLSLSNGFIGMLTGRTFMFLKWFEKVRTEILLKEARSEVVFDLNSTPGDNILDEATGRWAATVARNLNHENEKSECVFVRLTLFEGEKSKIDSFERAISSWLQMGQDNILYPVKLDSLRKLPRMPYSYWIPESLAVLFEKYPPLDRDNADKPNEIKIADLKQGLATADDKRFIRYWWEVNPNDIVISKEETLQGKKWVPYVKGGDPYYSDIQLVINWANNGEDLKNFSKSVIRNEDYYFQPGLCWSRILSSVLFDMRYLPSGVIFDCNGPFLLPVKNESLWSILSVINSSLSAFLFLSLDPTLHTRQIGYVSQLPIPLNAIGQTKLSNFTQEIYEILRCWDTGNEISTHFMKPWLLQFMNRFNYSSQPKPVHPLNKNFNWSDCSRYKELQNIQGSRDVSISELAKLCVEHEKRIKNYIYEIQQTIDEIVYNAYNISEKNREIVEKELKTLRGFPKALKKRREEEVKPEISIEDQVIRLLSYYVKLVLEEDLDGIVSLNDIFTKVRNHIDEDFSEEQRNKVGNEINNILGIGLEDWLSLNFFNFHVGLYERRPIFWHLTSSTFSRKRTSQGAFNCLLNYHKIDRDTIPKIRTRQGYLKGVLDGVKWRTERLRRELQEVKDSGNRSRERQLQAEYEEALDKYQELSEFDQKLEEVSKPRVPPTELDEDASWVERKIAEVRDNGYNPVIDYGVLVNITPFKEAGLLHPAADRVK